MVAERLIQRGGAAANRPAAYFARQHRHVPRPCALHRIHMPGRPSLHNKNKERLSRMPDIASLPWGFLLTTADRLNLPPAFTAMPRALLTPAASGAMANPSWGLRNEPSRGRIQMPERSPRSATGVQPARHMHLIIAGELIVSHPEPNILAA